MSRRNSPAGKARRRAERCARRIPFQPPAPAVPGDGSVREMARELVAASIAKHGRSEAALLWGAASSDDADLARAFVAGYRPDFRDEAYEGALRGISTSL